MSEKLNEALGEKLLNGIKDIFNKLFRKRKTK